MVDGGGKMGRTMGLEPTTTGITIRGPKRDPESYREIASNVGYSPSEILFLSDIVEELDAAHAAGFMTALIVRNGPPQKEGAHRAFSSLAEL